MSAGVLIVDDHALVAESLALALRAEGLSVVRADATTADRVRADVLEHRPDLVLLDLDLGEGMRGEEMVPWLRDHGARVLVVTGTADSFPVAAAIAAGAVGWVAKSAPFPKLVTTVLAVSQGEQVLPEAERARLVALWRAERHERVQLQQRVERLTPREREVLRYLLAGWRAEDVARELYVSLSTIRSQIRSILAKLEVSSQLSAVALAHRAKLEPVEHAS